MAHVAWWPGVGVATLKVSLGCCWAQCSEALGVGIHGPLGLSQRRAVWTQVLVPGARGARASSASRALLGSFCAILALGVLRSTPVSSHSCRVSVRRAQRSVGPLRAQREPARPARFPATRRLRSPHPPQPALPSPPPQPPRGPALAPPSLPSGPRPSCRRPWRPGSLLPAADGVWPSPRGACAWTCDGPLCPLSVGPLRGRRPCSPRSSGRDLMFSCGGGRGRGRILASGLRHSAAGKTHLSLV